MIWATGKPESSSDTPAVQTAELYNGPSAKFVISKVPVIAVTNFLLLAAFRPWRYPFYSVLRTAVFVSALYLALQAAELEKRVWMWLRGAAAILFNPFLPVRLPRSAWRILDLLAAALFALSLVGIRARNRRPP